MRPHAKSALLLLLLCLASIPAALAQENQRKTTGPRPLTRHEGLAILRVALDPRHRAGFPSDCSHLVHALYEHAGFPYEYAPSSDLYAGIDEFRRVARPQPGDLAVWPGHAGIVVNPAQHSFFSMLSSGPGVDSYNSPYWKQRGHPRFFRYLKAAPSGVLSSSIRTASLKP
jgi:cell wall-associated NlpC family hydrolase